MQTITIDIAQDTSAVPEGVTPQSWRALIDSIHTNRCLGTTGARSQYNDEPGLIARRIPGSTRYVVFEEL